MRHCSDSDAYTKRFDDAILDVPCRYKAGVTLNPEKFMFFKR